MITHKVVSKKFVSEDLVCLLKCAENKQHILCFYFSTIRNNVCLLDKTRVHHHIDQPSCFQTNEIFGYYSCFYSNFKSMV